MRDELKIYAASALGVGAPAANWFLDFVEPLLRVLVLGGQLGVAVVTILYIYSKWKKLHKKDDNDDSD